MRAVTTETRAAAARRTEPSARAEDAALVAVCVATCGRPRLLGALLESLAALRFRGPAPRVHLVIVDNDAAGSAGPVARAARAAGPFPVVYEEEPERNIARARNRGVRVAAALGARWVAFVDDDETVEPDWLERLLEAAATHGAQVVCGPVLPVFPPGAPAWMERGDFFGTRPGATGRPARVAYTGNVLVDARILEGPDPFDPRFGVTGGSDSHLFTRLRREGARMVWCAEAAVREAVPAARLRTGWILRRAFRVGNVAVRSEAAYRAGPLRPAVRLLKAGARLALGVATVPTGVAGRARLVRALWNVSYGLGALAAAAGVTYTEYRTLHGD